MDAFVVLRRGLQSHFKLLLGLSRQIGKAPKLFVLRPIPPTSIIEIAISAHPRGDGCKRLAGGTEVNWPEFHYDRWNSMAPFNTTVWNRRVGSAYVESHGEEDVVHFEV